MSNNKVFTEDENKIILEYLDKQIKYSEQKAEELRAQIKLYPEDSYSKQDLKNDLYLRNVLLAMKRRIEFKN